MTTCGLEKSLSKVGRMGLFPISSLCGVVLFVSSIVFVSCGPNMFLSDRDNEIKDAEKAIETARDDGHRAKAYSSRGTAYSEKARFSRISKLIPNEEYERLFDLSMRDHNQAVALNSGDAQIYFNRAQANYDRGALDLVENKDGKSWFDAAALDFEQAIKIDPKNSLALDRLGLTYESNGQDDKAIRAYTQQLAFDPFAKQRLADAYCNIGFRHQQRKEYPAAAVAYQKSLEWGTADDHSCPYDPLASLVAFYTTETREYDKAWETLHQAQKARRWIAPEVIDRLKKDSGRTN
jgi:tetratricopeptide (TPR) repeat protein